MKPEQAFYQKVRDALTPACHVQRFEAAGSGIPDVLVCYKGIETWTELKVGTTVLLRKEQYAWGYRHANYGGRVLVVNDYQNGGIIQIWQYPFINAIPKGKYLRITNPPHTNLVMSNIFSVYMQSNFLYSSKV